MPPIVTNPIVAAREVAPRDGLAGALGLGVIVPQPGTDPLDPADRWKIGYQLWGPSCGSIQAGTLGVCVPVDSGPPGSNRRHYPEPDPTDVPRWTHGPASAPFRVRTGITCNLQALADNGLADFQSEASRLLDLCQWSQIGYELWTGEQALRDGADNRYLADTHSTVVGNGVSVVEGIAAIEDALAACTCGDTNVIHTPRRVVPYMASHAQISSVTGQTARIFTHNGSLVVADRGYPGTGPGNVAPGPGGCWIYGTSVLTARLDPASETVFPQPTVGEAAIPSENTAIVRAERKAAISWLCCQFAARVTYT